MSMTTENRDRLVAMGLDPDAPALVAAPPPRKAREAKPEPEPEAKEPKKKKKKKAKAEPAQDEATRRSVPAEEVILDRALIEHLDLTQMANRTLALDLLHAHYKSPRKDSVRNKALHVRYKAFVDALRLEQAHPDAGLKTGGDIQHKIKTTAEQREIAALLASKGLTAADLAGVLGG